MMRESLSDTHAILQTSIYIYIYIYIFFFFFFLAGSKDLFLDHTVRQSRVPAFSTIGILGREPGGRDDDSDDSDEEMPL